MDKITDKIFIGNSSDANDLWQLGKNGIMAILNVALDLDTAINPHVLSLKAGLEDGLNAKNKTALDMAVSEIKFLVDHEFIVLVCCHDGVDRSPFVVANYLAEKNKSDWKKEFAFIQTIRPQTQIRDWMVDLVPVEPAQNENKVFDMAAFMVVKDDVFYVDMALKSVIPYVKGVYIQDQMSVDGTYEKVLQMKEEYPGKIVVEQIDTGTPERFGPDYNEPKFRNMALRRAEELFKAAWVLKLDADEIYTEYFFKRLKGLLVGNPKFECIRLSGERPISKDYWATLGSTELEKTEWSPEGGKFGDPHTQVWRAGKYYYACNPGLPGTFFHPILTPDPQPQYWLPGITNVHLHRTFGPKAFNFWAEGGEDFERKTPFHPPSMCPGWYNNRVNMGTAEKRDFVWPEYILTRWKEWGIW